MGRPLLRFFLLASAPLSMTAIVPLHGISFSIPIRAVSRDGSATRPLPLYGFCTAWINGSSLCSTPRGYVRVIFAKSDGCGTSAESSS